MRQEGVAPSLTSTPACHHRRPPTPHQPLPPPTTNQPQADKGFADKLDLPYRDVLMISPLVPTPFPPAVLVRTRALVVNLGAVRAVIAASEVYLLSVPVAHKVAPNTARWAFPRIDGAFETALSDRLAGRAVCGGPPTSPRASALGGALPYELRALEACLEAALTSLAADTDDLAADLPATLDALGAAATAASLATARATKVAIKRLAAWVDAVKRELVSESVRGGRDRQGWSNKGTPTRHPTSPSKPERNHGR